MLYRGQHVRYRRTRLWVKVVIALFLLAVLAYPFIEPQMLGVEQTRLTESTLTKDIGDLKIVYLSDIHEDSWPFFTHSRTVSLVRTINKLRPDIVILGGDYAMDSDGAIRFFENLPTIRATYGVFGIMGNHDRTEPESNLPTLRAAMHGAGVTPLINEVKRIRVGSSDICLAAIDDVDNGHPNLAGVAAQVTQDDYVIFLSHSPAIIPRALEATDANKHKGRWFDLGLFGHTHGGQVAGLGDMLGIAKVDSRYNQGWISENTIPMLISRGVGTSNLPIRLFCTPQIHVITINGTKK